jgi:Fe2+ or Zn2+ uptake regulation protein
MSYECVAERMHDGVYCVVVHAKCRDCGSVTKLNIPETEWLEWQAGALIQNALRSLPVADREIFISGTCGPCFDKLFEDSDE